MPAGGLKIFGFDLPRWMVHTPLLECLQFGATIGRYMDSGGTAGGGVVQAGKGLVKEVPFFKEPQIISDVSKAGGVGQGAEVLAVDELKPMIPMLQQNIARYVDVKPGEPYVFGEQEKRKPQGILEEIYNIIPGMGDHVSTPAEAKQKQAKKKYEENQEKIKRKKLRITGEVDTDRMKRIKNFDIT